MTKILLVDDNADLLQLAGRFLQVGGHSVTTASNGREAMRLIEAAQQGQTGAFDLVIADLIMPEQEGLETIMALRQKHPAIKIIAMSGGSRTNLSDNLRMAQKLSASQVLAKPFSGTELLAAVAAVLGTQETSQRDLRKTDGSV